MPRPAADRLLAFVLRVVAAFELAAVPFVAVPLDWMDAVHDELLGLGPLPRGPVVEYMARTLSGLYAVHGATLLFVSFDLPRYRPLVRLLGFLHLLFAGVIVGTDLSAGFPPAWAATEGALVGVPGLVILLTAGRKSTDAAAFPG